MNTSLSCSCLLLLWFIALRTNNAKWCNVAGGGPQQNGTQDGTLHRHKYSLSWFHSNSTRVANCGELWATACSCGNIWSITTADRSAWKPQHRPWCRPSTLAQTVTMVTQSGGGGLTDEDVMIMMMMMMMMMCWLTEFVPGGWGFCFFTSGPPSSAHDLCHLPWGDTCQVRKARNRN